MNYKERIDKVTDYIGKNLDRKLELNNLCQLACFSKYHFHRLFTVYTGLSLRQYIKWLRLRRAAYQLIFHRDNKIIEIALSSGFESHEAFSRAFKQVCGQSPSNFRSNANWRAWEKPPYSLPKQGTKNMNVIIKNLPYRRLAAIEHYGDPKKVGEAVNKLIEWAKSQPKKLKPASGEAFGFGYSDPNDVPAEEFRFDLAITVPKNYKLDGHVVEKKLPEGRYAVAVHKGSRSNVADTIYGLYRDWLPESGEELGNLPCIFCYLNFEDEVAETELMTEIWVLLK